MAISFVDIIRNSLKFSSINALAAAASLPVSVYVATVLTPADYGAYGILLLWLTYANLLRPGLVPAGYREIPLLLGRNERENALRLQNITITSDLLYSFAAFLVIIGASFFFSGPVMRVGLILTAFAYGANILVNHWVGVNFLRQNFNIAARGKFVLVMVSPLVILASITWLKVNALLLASVLAALIAFAYYWRKGPIGFRPTFDRKETNRLVRVGIVLQGGTLALWAFRLADRTVIATTLPLEQLGLYTFAMGFITTMLMIPTDFVDVLRPILYRELGKAASIIEGFRDTRRLAVYLALGTAVMVPAAQLIFYLIVSLAAKQYTGSIPIIYVLSYNLYLASIWLIADLVLVSSVVNRQVISLAAHIAGLGLTAVLDLLAVRWGYEVVGVAWVTVCTQGLVTITLYYQVRKYIFARAVDFFRFQVSLYTPFLVTIFFYPLHIRLGAVMSNTWAFAGISLLAQASLWIVLISIFYRSYISLEDIRAVLASVNTAVKVRLAGGRRNAG